MEDIELSFEDEMDIYSNKGIDELEENSELSIYEAAFMKGYNENKLY